MIDSAQQRVDRNLDRVRSLVKVYRKHLQGSGRGRREIQKTDVLRAAVVLIHATIEDFLRTIAYWKLPKADAEHLNGIPLASDNPFSKSTKFKLGELVAHRGKTVDEVIEESISQLLERSNYNNSTEIAALLRSIGCDVDPIQDLFADLDTLMSRRHNIVHRADENDKKGRGHHWAKPINPTKVEAWISLADDFTDRVAEQLS
jgi:hypothetical protein